ncbi:MAG: T9SS type A sorting domain-containing protein, partial [Oscillospiraceae bacterium]
LISAGQYHSLAIKSNGTLWAWGENDKGQLGIGNTTNQNSPVQIGTATNWVQVDAGIGYSFALKSDGTLWAWGNGNLGQLGTGNTIDQNSPVQVGTDTNWTQINIGANYSLALKTNGTLWAWGDNTLGQLGIGNTTQQNNPVQIGTVTNGASISAGGGHILSFVNPTASIDKNEIKNFVVYPNPANSILNIDSNAQEGIKITIVDIAGKTLAEQTLKTGNNTINISSFANGVYFIKTEKGGVMKFVKN